MIRISPVRTDADVAAAKSLAWEFVDFLIHRYPERRENTAEYLKEQRFEEMLEDFRHYFNPPNGECLLARRDREPVGIVMLKPVSPQVCEMNRMFVRSDARRLGVGRRLCLALFESAVALGFSEMRLGALHRHVEALPLYGSLGFETDPSPPRYATDDDGVIRLMKKLLPSNAENDETGVS